MVGVVFGRVLLALGVIAAAGGCSRAASPAPETVTVTPEASSATPAVPTPVPPAPAASANPDAINDKTAFCQMVNIRTHEISPAIDKFWVHTQTPGWSWSAAAADADNAVKVINRNVEAIKRFTGPQLPPEIAKAVGDYLTNLTAFAQGIDQRAPDEKLNELNQAQLDTTRGLDLCHVG